MYGQHAYKPPPARSCRTDDRAVFFSAEPIASIYAPDHSERATDCRDGGSDAPSTKHPPSAALLPGCQTGRLERRLCRPRRGSDCEPRVRAQHWDRREQLCLPEGKTPVNSTDCESASEVGALTDCLSSAYITVQARGGAASTEPLKASKREPRSEPCAKPTP